jgi:hypothetical protein
MAASPTRLPRLNTTLDMEACMDGACRAWEGAPAQCRQAHAGLIFEVIEASVLEVRFALDQDHRTRNTRIRVIEVPGRPLTHR